MLTCGETLGLLDEYYDGQLNRKASMQVAQHLENCGSCRAELRSIQITGAAFSEWDVLSVTPAFTASLHERLVQAAEQRTADHQRAKDSAKRPHGAKNALGYLRDWRLYAAAAACVAIVLAASYSMNAQYGYNGADFAAFTDGEEQVQYSGISPKAEPPLETQGETADTNEDTDAIDGSKDVVIGKAIEEAQYAEDDGTKSSRQGTELWKGMNSAAPSASPTDGIAKTEDNGSTSTDMDISATYTPPQIPTVTGSNPTPAPSAASGAAAESGGAATGQDTPAIAFENRMFNQTPTPRATSNPSAAQTMIAPTDSAGAIASPEPAVSEDMATAEANSPAPGSSSGSGGGSALPPAKANEEKADVVMLSAVDGDVFAKVSGIVNKYGTVAEYNGSKAIKVTYAEYEAMLLELKPINGWETRELTVGTDSQYVYVIVSMQ